MTEPNKNQTDAVSQSNTVDVVNVDDVEEIVEEESNIQPSNLQELKNIVNENIKSKTVKEETFHHKLNDLFIINLQDKEKRWDTITTRLKEEKCQKTFHRFFGINGSKMNMAEIRNDVSSRSGKYFMTHEMYGKAKSHYMLWKSILDKNNHIKNRDKNWFIILEDDAIIPTQFNNYLSNLETFLNNISDDTINNTDMFNLSPVGDYGGTRDFHQNIMTILTRIGSKIMNKHKSNNKKIENHQIGSKDWSVLNSNFPLCTHAYLVNLNQLENLIKVIDKTQIYFHLDWQLNFENVNINTITPIAIQRGGYDDSTSSATSNPTMPIQLLTMINKKLACDLGKPIFNIMGVYKINILIFVYIFLMLIWQLLDIPNRLNNFFLNINTKSPSQNISHGVI